METKNTTQQQNELNIGIVVQRLYSHDREKEMSVIGNYSTNTTRKSVSQIEK